MRRIVRKILKKVLVPPLVLIAALYFFIEEVLWEWLKDVTAYIARLPFIAAIEPWIARQGPKTAMAILIGVEAPVISLKVLVAWLWAHGFWVSGTSLLIVVKILATALMVRLFILTKPALMQVHWFARTHDKFLYWKQRAHDALERLPLWQQTIEWRKHLREFIRTRRRGLIASIKDAVFRLKRRSRT